jgi:hypothetical protein
VGLVSGGFKIAGGLEAGHGTLSLPNEAGPCGKKPTALAASDEEGKSYGQGASAIFVAKATVVRRLLTSDSLSRVINLPSHSRTANGQSLRFIIHAHGSLKCHFLVKLWLRRAVPASSSFDHVWWPPLRLSAVTSMEARALELLIGLPEPLCRLPHQLQPHKRNRIHASYSSSFRTSTRTITLVSLVLASPAGAYILKSRSRAFYRE